MAGVRCEEQGHRALHRGNGVPGHRGTPVSVAWPARASHRQPGLAFPHRWPGGVDGPAMRLQQAQVPGLT